MRLTIVLAVAAAVAVAGWIVLRDVFRSYRSTRAAVVTHFTIHSLLVHRDLHEISWRRRAAAPRRDAGGAEALRRRPATRRDRRHLDGRLRRPRPRAPRPARFCAVGAHSAGLWAEGGETPAGAFDDAADFSRHDVLSAAHPRRIYRVPVWIDVGRDDPFLAADTTLARRLEAHGTQQRVPRYSR